MKANVPLTLCMIFFVHYAFAQAEKHQMVISPPPVCLHLLQPDGSGFQVVRLDVDRRVVVQLCAPDFVSDSSGRVQVVSKAMLRKRGGVSPDRAEAVLLALYEPVQVREVPLVVPVGLVQRNVWRV
jgi:hypothetical protein